MAAGRDELMPHSLSRLNNNNAPQNSIILLGILATIIMLLNFSKGLVAAYTFMLLISTLSTLLAYALASVSALIMEKKNPTLTGSERKRHLAIAFMAFVFSTILIAAAGPEPVYWGFLLLLVGLPVYVWSIRFKR